MVREQAGRVLGANLRALREAAGLSLSELARRSDIAKGTLSQLESGTGNPTIETVFSLSNALAVPVSSLLTERTDPEVRLVRSAGLEVLSSSAVDLRMLRRLDVTERVLELYDHGPPEAPYELGPGDYVCFPAQRPHSYETVGGPVVSVLLLEYPADAGPPTLGASCAAVAQEG